MGALACNTGHMVFGQLEQRSPIPLVSIVETTCAAAKRQNRKKVGLIGTMTTMEDGYFKEPFQKSGIEVVIPCETDRIYIADRILRELEFGIVKEDTVRRFVEIAEKMAEEDGAETLILGCTELPLLFQHRSLPVPVLDTVKLHIQALLNAILEDPA